MTKRRRAAGATRAASATGGAQAPLTTLTTLAAVAGAVTAIAMAGAAMAADGGVVTGSAVAASAAAATGSAVAAGSAAAADAAPGSYLQFVEDFSANCTMRNGVQRLIRNTHPTRTLRVWLDRYHMGQGTGDRSRSDLPPGGEPEPLGCSRTVDGPQEWRPVRAVFVD